MVTLHLQRICLGVLAAMAATSMGCTQPNVSSKPAAPEVADARVSIREIEFPFARVVMPQKVDGVLFAAAHDGRGGTYKLVRYDLTRLDYDTLFESVSVIGSVDANERWLLWENDLKLYAQSLVTGERAVLADSRDLYGPALRGDEVAYIDLTTERRHRVVIRDLVTKETTVVAPIHLPGLHNNDLAWSGSNLVWADVVADRVLYRMYDSASDELVDYELDDTRHPYPGWVTPAGGLIYSLNFPSKTEWDWTRQRLGYFTPANRTWTPVSEPGEVNYYEPFVDRIALLNSSQELELRPLGGSLETKKQRLLGPVDFIKTSSDGTLIAVKESPDLKPARLYLVALKQ